MTRFKIYQHMTPNDRPGIELEVDSINVEAYKSSPVCNVSIGLKLEISPQYNEFVEFHEITNMINSWNDRMPLIFVKCDMTRNSSHHKAYRFYKFEECRNIDIIPNRAIGYEMKFTAIIASMETKIGDLIVTKM